MKILGRHLIVEYAQCDNGVLDNLELMEKYLTWVLKKSSV